MSMEIPDITKPLFSIGDEIEVRRERYSENEIALPNIKLKIVSMIFIAEYHAEGSPVPNKRMFNGEMFLGRWLLSWHYAFDNGLEIEEFLLEKGLHCSAEGKIFSSWNYKQIT